MFFCFGLLRISLVSCFFSGASPWGFFGWCLYKLDPNHGGLDDFRFHFRVMIPGLFGLAVLVDSQGFDFYAVLRRMQPKISQLQETRQVWLADRVFEEETDEQWTRKGGTWWLFFFFWGGFPLDDEIRHWILMLRCTIKIVKSPVGFPLFFSVAQLQRWGRPVRKEAERELHLCHLLGVNLFFISSLLSWISKIHISLLEVFWKTYFHLNSNSLTWI